MLRGGSEAPAQANPFGQATSPINLLAMGGTPPTAGRIPLPTSNPRGLNMGGKVNTNISMKPMNSNPESALINRATNLQR
jgi:hypothetical protein